MPRTTELAWAAGFFDGEGSTKLDRRHDRAYISIQIGHVEPEPLRRFHAAVSAGSVTGPYAHNRRKNKRWSEYYSYQAYGKTACAVIEQLWPYLSGPKKRQWLEKINDDAARTGRMSSSAAENN